MAPVPLAVPLLCPGLFRPSQHLSDPFTAQLGSRDACVKAKRAHGAPGGCCQPAQFRARLPCQADAQERHRTACVPLHQPELPEKRGGPSAGGQACSVAGKRAASVWSGSCEPRGARPTLPSAVLACGRPARVTARQLGIRHQRALVGACLGGRRGAVSPSLSVCVVSAQATSIAARCLRSVRLRARRTWRRSRALRAWTAACL